ncbi:MAG TPA: hypothetical protein VMU05_01975, partial [Dongiaceae bacterium]|nr:hypothetical protein [Dongiaceae bacterium]
INPSQFPISGVAIDPLDVSGKTAYVTLMGFTGGTGHVWKTTNAGASWTDFTANLPDSPTNAVLVYAPMSEVFVATDLGVFASPTSAANWTELGPAPGSGQIGFLPNVAVTALGIFNYGGQQLLRASTYGRGMWQFNLLATPDFQLSLSNPSQTISAGQTANFSGSASALNGYASSVALSCVSGITAPPPTCTLSPSALTPGRSTPFTVTAGGSTGDYYFNVQGKGSDSNHVTHQIAAALHVTGGTSDFTLSGPASPPIANAGGSTTISNAISVTATSGFQGVIALTCSVDLANGAAANATCSTAPGTVTSIPSQVNVTVDSTNLSANQNATDGFKLVIKGSSGSITHTLVIPFNVGDYGLSGPPSLTAPLGGQVTENVNIAASAYYGGKINATCDASSLPGAICNLSPVNPVPVNVGATVQLVATINVPASASAGATYKFNINTQDTTGVPSHSFTFSLNAVQNFSITPSPTTQTVSPGGITSSYNLTVAPVQGAFTGAVAFSCLGLPAGAGCAFNPPTVTPGSSSATVAMTISTAIATIANSYTVTVLATSGSLSNSVPVTLVVSKDFQVTLVQDLPANATGGQTVSALVNLNPNYSGSVNAYCDSTTIAGSTCTIAPVNPVLLSASVPMQLAVTLKLPNNAAPGSYPVNLKATDSSGLPSHSQSLSLTITDFSVTSSTASQTVSTGQTTGPYQLTIAPNPSGSSFSGAVTLSCGAGLPTGAQCVFNPSTPVTPGSSAVDVVMSIATGTATPAGTYNVSVTGTSGTLVHASAVDLVVTNNGTGNAPDFQLVITQPFPASVAAGSSQVAKVSLTPSYSGAVNANCDASAIPGAQCTITPQSPISISANQPSVLAIALNLPNTAVPGTYNVNVEVADSGGEPSHSLQLPIAVIADFSVSSSTPSQTVTAGQTSGAYQLTVAPNPPGSSFSGAVTLSCAGLPTGGQCIFQPAGPVTPGTSAVDVVMNISTSKDTVESQSVQADVFPLAAIWMPLAIFIVGTSVAGKRTWKNPSTWLGCLTCFLALMMLMSCAGVSSAGGGGGQSPPSTTYHVTITGTSPGTPVDAGQSTTVTLVVN